MVEEEVALVRWEYHDRMVMFTETPDGLTSGLDWLNDAGRQGWELVGAIPLIAPNRDGVAYGTVGVHLIFKRSGEARRRPPRPGGGRDRPG
jgi:hypothetical protein